jgi:hypothetical protein
MNACVLRSASALFLAVAFSAGCGESGGGDGKNPPAAQVADGGNGTVTPVPLPTPNFPLDSATIDGWISNPAGPDTAQIRAHAWAIWAGLTQRTAQMSGSDSLPVYETWPTSQEVFDTASAAPPVTQARRLTRGLHVARQFGHSQVAVVRERLDASPQVRGAQAGGKPAPPARLDSALVMVTVSYNTAAASHIRQNGYYLQSTLDSLNTYFNSQTPPTPTAARNIQLFPDSAVALKPTYLPVSADGFTILPYWAGPQASTDPVMPDINTWTQCVAVDPTGKSVGMMIRARCNTIETATIMVVGLDQFYHFSLDSAEAAAFYEVQGSMRVAHGRASPSASDIIPNPLPTTLDSVMKGDYGVLVAMHVTTKEISNWTWQTFWWTPNPDQDPLASDHPASVTGPFRNYAMKPAYYMTVPNGPSQGQDVVTFNPYLEPDLAPQGKTSNCMTCHRSAIWVAPPQYTKFSGNLYPNDPYFNNATKVDFLWSIQGNSQP